MTFGKVVGGALTTTTGVMPLCRPGGVAVQLLFLLLINHYHTKLIKHSSLPSFDETK